jgi:alanine racemase
MDYNSTRAEISLNALTHNLTAVKSLLNQTHPPEIIAVVKANAYGHGIEAVTAHLYSSGVRNFAVSDLREAEQIKDLVPNGNILILGVCHLNSIEFINTVVMNDYIQTIPSVVHARRICEQLRGMPKILRCHVKTDTGMTRFGISTTNELDEIMKMPELRVEAVFTHFPHADSCKARDVEFTINQQAKFVEFARKYKNDGLKIHSQNSAGVLYHREFEADFVRVGLALYGYRPNTAVVSPIELKPVMSVKSAVAQVREVAAGTPVGYSRSYHTDSAGKLAVIPVGYADGYSRLNSNRGKVVINGKIAPIRGKVCMDYIIADVSGIDGVEIGDEVLIYSDLYKETSIEHIADELGTIPYEVTCAVASRVPRAVI